MGMRTLRDRVKEITERRPDPNRQYYALTILADEKGNLTWSCYSHWAGWADAGRRIELRAASLVHADNMAKLWTEIGEGCVVLDDVADMQLFLLLGGNALVERAVAESVVPEVLRPQPVVRTRVLGFHQVESIPRWAFSRAPTPAERMRVLKRDGFRCRVCGRRPTDHVDVELHVHHIRPWADGGVTHEANLITLCHTCHNGLDPHSELGLFDLIAPTGKALDVAQSKKEYWEGVGRYRQRVVQDWSSSTASDGDDT